MSPFPQSVVDSSAFPAVFLLPLGIFQVAFVLLRVPKYLQWPRWIRGQSVLKQVSVAVSNVQKCYFVINNQCRYYACKKRK